MVVAEGEKRSSFPGVVVGEAGGANASQQDPPPRQKESCRSPRDIIVHTKHKPARTSPTMMSARHEERANRQGGSSMAEGTGEPMLPFLCFPLTRPEADQLEAAEAAFWPTDPPFDQWVECPLSTSGDTGASHIIVI